MQELYKDKVILNIFNLNKNKSNNAVLINQHDLKRFNILYRGKEYFLCKDVAFILV